MDFDEGMGEVDPGPLVYQEVKVFHTEPSLCNVYDNTQLRAVTFEVYGLDTQNTLKLKYDYPQYDQLFRFNAELMNPNRKEGRFHWTIERLEIHITNKGSDRKLKLGEKPTEEVASLPVYETVRKIPTGRMDLKERQRLREQMDILDIRRAENIARKRAATKERILKHIFFLKEEQIRKKQEQADRMEAERQLRFKKKEDEERKEEEQLKILETKSRLRRKAIEAVMSRNEEQEEFELAQMRLRWKAADEERARIIRDAIERRDRLRKEDKDKQFQLAKKRSDAQNKRSMLFKKKNDNKKARDDAWLQAIFESKTLRARANKMRGENKQDALRDWNSWRIPTFAAQLARTYERTLSREAENEAVGSYQEKRAVPKKVKTKGHKNKIQKEPVSPKAEVEKAGKDDKKKKAKKDDKKKEEETPEEDAAKDAAKDAQKMEKVLDSVEAKVRQEMEEERRRARMNKVRIDNIGKMEKARSKKEMDHLSEVRAAARQAAEKEKALFAERIHVMKEKETELQASMARKKQERERLNRKRDNDIVEREKKWLARKTAGGA